MTQPVLYEYAGFQFKIYFDGDRPSFAIAEPGQHQAAYKEKHRHAAIDCYRQDHPMKRG